MNELQKLAKEFYAEENFEKLGGKLSWIIRDFV